MQIVYKSVNELIPYINNSRTHDEEQITQIASSIKEYGFTNPILIDENNGIIAGHGRLLASKKLNMEQVPCIVLKDLTEVQKKAYVIADNKMALNAGWDEDLLKLELENLKELDFDLDLTGFDNEEIDKLLEFNVDYDEFGEDFELKDGDREPIQTMNLTFSDDQVETVNEAISKMKQSDLYKEYEGINKNSNGNALYLVVLEWLQQKI